MPGTEFIVKYLSDIKDATKGARDLEKINADIAKNIGREYANATEIIGKSLQKISSTPFNFKGNEVTKTVSDTATVVKAADGTFQQFTKTQTALNGTLVKTTGSMKDVTSQFKQSDVQTAKLAQTKKNLFQIMAELGVRALIIVPIWGAMRAALQGLTSAITNSIQGIARESLSLEKARQTLQGTTDDIKRNFEALRNESEALSLQTGVDQDKIIATFQKFSSVGLSFASAMTATTAATKLAVITQSEAADSTENFATSLNILIDKTKSTEQQGKQITDIFSLIGELAQTNGFSVGEFSGSLEKFATTAKSANFTTSQTIALLATLSKSGLGQAGNVFRNSIGQLLSNLDQLAGSLGIKVNPALDDTFSILVKVLEQVNKLQGTNDLAGLTQARDALKDLFGGSRGAVPITALATLFDSLKANLALTPDIDKFNQRFKDTTEVVGSVITRINTLNRETGEAFLTGLLGGDNFADTLQRIAGILTQIQKNAQGFGEIIGNVLTLRTSLLAPILIPLELDTKVANLKANLNRQIVEALQGSLSTIDLTTLFDTLLKVQTLKLDVGIAEGTLDKSINNIREQIVKQTAEGNNEARKTQIIEEDILSIQLKKTDFLKLEGLLKKELSANGLTEIDIESKILDLRTASGQFLKADIELQKELVDSLKSIEAIELRRENSRGLIDKDLELLRIQGSSTLEVTKRRIALEKEQGINQTKEDLLKNQLELEKQITAEKLGQNTVSNTATKLQEIAKENGIQAAKAIANVLSGGQDFTTFFRIGGENLEIFKKQFADVFKTQQSNAFFSGQVIPGLNDIQGGDTLLNQGRQTRLPFNNNIPQQSQDLINRLTGAKEVSTATAREVFRTRPEETVQTIRIEIDGKVIQASAVSPEVLQKLLDSATPKIMESIKKASADPFSPLGEQQRTNIDNF